ncbi:MULTISPECIES: TrmH family RNA methyltransferase [unclassified Paraflavitalea]|uniref:TrmH family RNA methyltransferase n=1 Tax=unclassified Paraflavitalea TaxID=2798305 RepID=UPI003D32F6EE
MLVKSQVKYIQSLSQKKFRDEIGEFTAEGPKIINEFLAAPNIQIKEVFALASWIEEHENALKTAAIPFTEVSHQELERISQLQTPAEVLAIVKKPVFNADKPVSPWILILDTIQDPGNLGTIIRTADWFGITDIVASPQTADYLNPKVVQATMGSLSRVRIIYTPLEFYIDQIKDRPILAAHLNGSPLQSIQKPEKGALIIGNESKGIAANLITDKVVKITIPAKGGAESLNAAVATGILLSHLT